MFGGPTYCCRLPYSFLCSRSFRDRSAVRAFLFHHFSRFSGFRWWQQMFCSRHLQRTSAKGYCPSSDGLAGIAGSVTRLGSDCQAKLTTVYMCVPWPSSCSHFQTLILSAFFSAYWDFWITWETSDSPPPCTTFCGNNASNFARSAQ